MARVIESLLTTLDVQKKCLKCQQFKKIDEFHLNPSNKTDGHRSRCKVCYNAERNQRYNELNIRIRKPKTITKQLIKSLGFNSYYTYRSSIDISFKLQHNLRSRFYRAFKKGYKKGSSIKLLGCSIEEFKIYLESQFKSGMTWDNYGEWEIDHIQPLSNFNLTNENELIRACNYNNLQPLWKSENRRKSNKKSIGF